MSSDFVVIMFKSYKSVFTADDITYFFLSLKKTIELFIFKHCNK